jgi:1A family penicillin-binding protein
MPVRETAAPPWSRRNSRGAPAFGFSQEAGELPVYPQRKRVRPGDQQAALNDGRAAAAIVPAAMESRCMASDLASSPNSGSAMQARSRSRLRFAAAGFAGAILLLAGAVSGFLYDVHFPSAAEVTSRRVIVLKSADGQDLRRKGNLQLAPVEVRDIPAVVVNAVLSIEDRRFYRHGGVDPLSELRALRQNIEGGKILSGGSTITQQLVKILFLSPERTYRRKAQEAAIAIWIEHHLTKNEILASYLNNVYLGSGATGFPAAARLYFDKKVADLSLPEAAMLAGMINAPAQDNPLHNPEAARRRAATVLDAMVANGKLTEDAALAAKLHPAMPASAQISPPSTGWFADWVYNKATAVTSPFGGTVRIQTTLDLHLQEMAVNIVKSTLAEYGREKHAEQAALVAMRPDGAVVAMVGGRSYASSQYNRVVQAERQPGSAFKLFDYYAALRAGFTPDDKILDAPIDIHGWRPENYGHRFHGNVTLAEAFADSLNDATVRLSQKVGIGAVIAAARDLGLRAPLQDNASLALGTGEVTLLDLTSAYAAVRAGKAPVNAWGISGVKTPNDPHYQPIGHPDQSQHSLGQYQDELIHLLQGVIEHGTGRAAALQGFAAGKTGTTQDYRDAWFVGFDDSLVVGVWVGNDDHSPMRRVVGGSLPAGIWKDFMDQASAPMVAGNTPTISSVQPPEVVQSRQASGPADQNAGEDEGAQCNVPVCEEYYRSFRVSDCSYQPYWGGPREYCER